ncbi:MAG: cytochrome c [Polyangiaceae bacterium]
MKKAHVSTFGSASLVFTLALAGLAACHKPLDAPLADIPKLGSLEEVMRANETVAGSKWSLIGKASYSDDEFTQLKDVAARVDALSERAKAFSKGPEFDALAIRLGEKAKALGAAAEAKDAAAASTALEGMKKTCKDCHAAF